MPGGKVWNNNFYSLGKSGSWWLNATFASNDPVYLNLNRESGNSSLTSIEAITGFSVRCIRNEQISVATLNTPTVSNISAIGATIHCNITDNGGGSISEKGVCWSTQPYPTIDDNSQICADQGLSYSVEISNLSDITTFYVRAYARNEAGISYGYMIQFITESIEYEPCPGLATFNDARDGTTYSTVLIGDQCWIRENLSYLPQVDSSTHQNDTISFYYVYGYSGNSVGDAKSYDSYQNYGVLYNFPAAANACPEGWHLPEKEEWDALADYLGGKDIAGGKLKSTQTVPDPKPRWNSPNTAATNESFFSGFPGGNLNYQGSFVFKGKHGYWWSSSSVQSNKIWFYDLSYNNGELTEWYINKSSALSVRCIKNND
jgi:uncharacterized protein (TIGR02145 family)